MPHRSARVAIVSWLLVSATVAGPGGVAPFGVIASAHAAGRTDTGKALADEAAGLFKAGKYLQAAELFERSFALSPDKLVRLRNAGRAYEEAGRLDNARLVFERYLALAPASPEREEVAARLARVQEALAAQRRGEAAPAAPAASKPAEASAPSPAPATPVTPTPVPLERPAAPAASDRAPTIGARRLSTPKLPWALMGGGVVVAGLGVGWQLYVMSAQNQLNAQSRAGLYDGPNGQSAYAVQQDEIHNAERAAWTLIGVGSAAALAGGYLLWRQRATEPRVTVWPALGGGMAGAMLQGHF